MLAQLDGVLAQLDGDTSRITADCMNNIADNQKEEITMKAVLPGLILLGGLLAIATAAISAGSPPTTEQAKKVEALVTKAAALIDEHGNAAFAEVGKRDSEWFHGDTYLFLARRVARLTTNFATACEIITYRDSARDHWFICAPGPGCWLAVPTRSS